MGYKLYDHAKFTLDSHGVSLALDLIERAGDDSLIAGDVIDDVEKEANALPERWACFEYKMLTKGGRFSHVFRRGDFCQSLLDKGGNEIE